MALFCDSPSHITPVTLSDDVYTLISMLKDPLMIQISHNTASVTPNGWPFKSQLDAGNSGILLRFVSALAATQPHKTIITGDASCQTRPMTTLVNTLIDCGAQIQYLEHPGFAPLSIHGPLTNTSITIHSEDSQPISALLNALALTDQPPASINLQHAGERPFISMTIDWLRFLGHQIVQDHWDSIRITPKTNTHGFETSLPIDIGLIGHWLVWSILHQKALSMPYRLSQWSQPDTAIINLLKQMGAKITIHAQKISITPPKIINPIQADLNDSIDLLPLMALMATQADTGPSMFSGIRIATTKECNRPKVIQQQLGLMGAAIDYHDDTMVIYPSALHHASLDHYQDHRMAMMLHLANSICADAKPLSHDHCINKSFPQFKETFTWINQYTSPSLAFQDQERPL